MASRKIEVQIVGDASKLERSFRNASRSASGFGDSMRSAASGAAKLAAVGVGVGLGLVAVAAKKAVDAASNLGESMNAVNVVFGKAAGQVHAFAKVAATEAGLSMRQFNELVTPIGASLQNVGFSADEAAKASINLGKRAADMASVFNVDVSEAMTAIQAGLRGEADPLERFGVGLSAAAVNAKAMAMGLAESEKALSANDKAQARLALLMEQTNKVAGDFKNTSDGLANSQRIFHASLENVSAQIGTALLPALANGMQAVGEFVTKFAQAQGLKAKVEVVIEGAKNLASAALKIGQDAGKQVMAALSAVDWGAAGNKIASAIGEAFRKGIPTLAKFAQTITEGFKQAIQQADWVTIGANIGQGIKDGVKKEATRRVKEGMVDTIKSAEPATVAATRAVASDVAHALVNQFRDTSKKEIPKATTTVGFAIRQGLDPAIAVAAAQGGRIGAGLSGGLVAALSGVGQSVANTIIWQINASELQIKQKYGIHSPSTVWAREIGKPLADGIVMGMDGGLALLAPKMKAKIDAAIARAQAVVEAARSRMESSFSLMSDKLMRVFDAETGGTRTPAEQAIANIQARRQQESLQKALADAIESGDTAAIARAQEDITLAGLEAQAAVERKAWDDQRAAMRERLEGRLGALQAHFSKEGATVKAALTGIQRLMMQFGVSFEEAGDLIGRHFAAGFAGAVGGAAASVGGVRGARTGGDATPGIPVVQVVLDGKVLAESNRKQDAIYARANGTVQAV